MFYLGIDQHAKQLTVDLCDESGDLVDHRRVSTEPRRLSKYLTELQASCSASGGFVAIVEVTGFNDYLLELLRKFGCRQVVVVQPHDRQKRKTDRRDARQLRDLLWTNRDRIFKNQHIIGVRVVTPPTPEEARERQLTSLMRLLRKHRTQTLNRMHTLLKKHNLQHAMPAKRLDAVRSQHWLEKLPLQQVDGFERDLLQRELRHIDRQIKEVEEALGEHFVRSPAARIVGSTPGLSVYGSLVVSSRLGDVRRFRNGDAAANFVGLTPSCRNSDNAIRHGSVTKLGSSFIRHILCQGLVHVLRKDAWIRQWYKRIKTRRGANVARVAVMRRLVVILYAMLRDEMPYVPGGPERYQRLLAVKKKENLSFQEVQILIVSNAI